MKKTTLFSLLAVLFLFVCGNVRADDELFYTLNAVKSSHNAYAGYADVTVGDMTWNAPGNQSLDGGIWRIGGKSLDGVDRYITAKTPMASAICRVVFNHNGVSRNTITINSMSLIVASDAEFATILDQVQLTPTIEVGTAGSVEFVPDAGFGTEWPTDAYYKFAINVTSTTTTNGGLDMTSIEFYAPLGDVVVAKPVITPNGGTFVEAQEVTITSEGNTIYYTLDGTDPTDASTQYTAPFTLSSTCTVKAIAYNDDDNSSSIASAEFKFLSAITSIAELCAAATETREPAFVAFNNWICTGVAGANAYFTDGQNGVLLYQSGHGFEQGDVLTGTAQLTLTLYNECAEIIGLTATTAGVTVTKGEGAIPLTVAISDLEKNMQGNLITLEGVTYNAAAGVFVDDDDNEIIPYNRFITLPTLVDGKTYNATGVAIWYKAKQKWEIAPRTEDEFQLLTSLILPESSWIVESQVVDLGGEVNAQFVTNSDGAVTYSSSDETVATIDAEGNITLVGQGTTTITAYVAESETYLADSRSFTLTVKEAGYETAVFAYGDADIQGQGESGAKGVGFTATRDDLVTLTTNNAYGNSTYIQIYGSKYETVGEGEEAEKVLSEPSYVQLAVPEDYAIVKIVLNTTSDYTQTWEDQLGVEPEIEGTVVTWEDKVNLLNTVTLTNKETKQARIKTISVTYINSDVITAISTPNVAKEDAAIYNLAGQRLQKMQKGINIVGGRKIAVK